MGQAFKLDASITGPGTAKLSKLIGIKLPELPRYRVSGHIVRRQDILQVENLQARIGSSDLYALRCCARATTNVNGSVGDSDLSGRIKVNVAGKKRMVSANLNSELLDFDDLGGLIGAASSGDPGETASPSQKERATRQRASGRALPEQAFQFALLSQFNANVRYRADAIDSARLPLDGMTLDFTLDNGCLKLNPLQFGVAGGAVSANIVLDSSKQPARGKIEMEVKRLQLAKIMQKLGVAEDSLGVIRGRALLSVKGDSVARMLASADGGASLLMIGGELNTLLVELAGLEGGEALLTWLNPKVETVDIRCAFADLQTRNGVVDLAKAVVDTAQTKFIVEGSINLQGEKLQLVIYPRPKSLSLFAVTSPLIVGGSFKAIDVHPSRSSLIARGAAALALGAIAPPLALLALVQPGRGKDAPCRRFQDTLDNMQ